MSADLTVAQRIAEVRTRIDAAAERYGRSTGEVRLIAIGKTKPAGMIRDAYACGQRDFGESYVQEGAEKIAALRDLAICWHFVGPIQSNKTRTIAEQFDWVHSVDRIRVAERLSGQRPPGRDPLNVLLQVNISGEESKSGVAPHAVAEVADAIAALPGLTLRGLMGIPAPAESFAEQRAPFARLRELLAELQARSGGGDSALDQLSMGMSADLEAAIAEGATMIRIGTALFGARGG